MVSLTAVASLTLASLLGVGIGASVASEASRTSAAGLTTSSILQGLTVDELQSQAELVVSARALRSRAIVTNGRVETETVVRVERAFVGEAGRTLRVRVPGGRLQDGRVVRVPGAPQFTPGEPVLLFLSRSASSAVWTPVGLFQGVWRLDPAHPGACVGQQRLGRPVVAFIGR